MGIDFGFYQGASAKNILLLGESHHWCKEDANKSPAERNKKEQEYSTNRTVERYLHLHENGGYDPAYAFFEKIAQTFGFEPAKDRMRFWNSVYFKNYVTDGLCGVGDSKAKNRIFCNREKYNNDLFRFINEHGITTVFVFSRLVYKSLPQFARGREEKQPNCDDGTLTVGKRKDYLSHCIYVKGETHGCTKVLLARDAAFFGMRHPSARGGYRPENYVDILRAKFEAACTDIDLE